MSQTKKISVVIPAKNEEGCLPQMLAELPKDLIYEIIVVDGHSTDNTVKVVKDMGFTCITQEGKGYGMAVSTGLKHATGEYVTFIDADGSYDPAALPIMLKGIEEEGFDAVFCSRYLPESGSDDDTFIRLIGNKFFTWMLRFVHGVRLSDSLFLYMLTKRSVFNHFDMQSKTFEWCIEFPINIHNSGFKYKEIPSRERPRLAGESKVNAVVDGLIILWWMIKFRLQSKSRIKMMAPSRQ